MGDQSSWYRPNDRYFHLVRSWMNATLLTSRWQNWRCWKAFCCVDILVLSPVQQSGQPSQIWRAKPPSLIRRVAATPDLAHACRWLPLKSRLVQRRTFQYCSRALLLLPGTGSSHAAAASELVIQEFAEGAVDRLELRLHRGRSREGGEGRAAWRVACARSGHLSSQHFLPCLSQSWCAMSLCMTSAVLQNVRSASNLGLDQVTASSRSVQWQQQCSTVLTCMEPLIPRCRVIPLPWPLILGFGPIASHDCL